MLTEQQLGEYIDRHFTSTLFRLETLETYDVGGDDEDFRRYLAGQSGPTSKWPEVVRGEVASGKHTYRVHLVNGPLTDYLRYEFEWCYGPNASAGEHIRILDTVEAHKPAEVLDEDFWIVDDEQLIRMHYSRTGEFEGATLGSADELPRFRTARDAAWSSATDFSEYWRRHPHYHRDPVEPVTRR